MVSKLFNFEKSAVTCRKIKYQQSTDTLRIPEKYRKCRYAKISQLLKAGQFCRYVGDIKSLEFPPKSGHKVKA
jgi:hypothetical protein